MNASTTTLHADSPRNRITLLKGGPGSGKTVFALQTLVNAVRNHQESGIFVAFEESSRQIVANAAGFDWRLSTLPGDQLFFMDAPPTPDQVRSGEFDLTGLLALLKARKEAIGARWIVFDGIDVLLTLPRGPMAVRKVCQIRDWLVDNALTAILTARTEGSAGEALNYCFLQFMFDCVIRFERRLDFGVPVHHIQITKYRGSDFVAGEYPVSYGSTGMQVDAPEPAEIRQVASSERVSAGFERLDTMLGGGLFRGSIDHRRRALELAEADTRDRIKALEHDLGRQRAELARYSRGNEAGIVSPDAREPAFV